MSAATIDNKGGTAASEYVTAASSLLPVLDGVVVRMTVWHRDDGEDVTVVLEHGERVPGVVPSVRIHSACMTGDVFGSLKCDCGRQLHQALFAIAAEPWGAIVYPLAHEGRGIGLINKVLAYAHQESGLDTFAANEALGFESDLRSYAGAAQILNHMGMHEVRLLTRNPLKVRQLVEAGVNVVESVPVDVAANAFNDGYLATKATWFAAITAEYCEELGADARA